MVGSPMACVPLARRRLRAEPTARSGTGRRGPRPPRLAASGRGRVDERGQGLDQQVQAVLELEVPVERDELGAQAGAPVRGWSSPTRRRCARSDRRAGCRPGHGRGGGSPSRRQPRRRRRACPARCRSRRRSGSGAAPPPGRRTQRGSDRAGAEHRPCTPGCSRPSPAYLAGHGPQPFGPGRRPGAGMRTSPMTRAQHAVEHVVLVLDVVVERHGLDAQCRPELAHAQGVETVLVDQLDRRRDDSLARQRRPFRRSHGATLSAGRQVAVRLTAQAGRPVRPRPTPATVKPPSPSGRSGPRPRPPASGPGRRPGRRCGPVRAQIRRPSSTRSSRPWRAQERRPGFDPIRRTDLGQLVERPPRR